MIRSTLCNYSDAYIPVKGTITVQDTSAADAPVNNTNKKVIFKSCAPLTNCITEISNTEVDDTEHINIVMPIYNLIEYRYAYLKTLESLRKYYRNAPSLDSNNNIINFPANNNNSALFKCKQQITGQTGNGSSKNAEITVPLKYLSNFWGTPEVPLINCRFLFSWNGLKNMF